MTAHTGPAPLESPEAMRLDDDSILAEKRRYMLNHGSVSETDLVRHYVRARDAQWVERLTRAAEEAERTAKAHADRGEAGLLGERMAELRGAAAALRDAAKMGGGE